MAPAAQQVSSTNAKTSCDLRSALNVKYDSVKRIGASSSTLERFDSEIFKKIAPAAQQHLYHHRHYVN